MLKLFHHYCDLYNLPGETYLPVAKIIVTQPQALLQTSHRHGYVFFTFQQLCRNELTMEEFFCVGDVTSPFDIFGYQEKNKPDLYIMDELIKGRTDERMN